MPKTLNDEDVMTKAGPLSQEELAGIDRYWRAANLPNMMRLRVKR